MSTLEGKTLFITGASRGIGEAIGLRAACDGASIVIAAKTDQPHPRLPGTIHTAAERMREAGGRALALVVDVRSEDQIASAVDRAVQAFGGIDILVNNASAISLTGTLATPMKRFDLMHQVNVRGTFACSQACIPYLARSENPHILNISPPLDMRPRWFSNHVAYTMSKYGMSMCVLGMAAELAKDRIAVNALWPATAIATSAMKLIAGDESFSSCRWPTIVADAAHAILTSSSASCTGNFFVDEDVLLRQGVTDLSAYAVDPEKEPIVDFFLDR